MPRGSRKPTKKEVPEMTAPVIDFTALAASVEDANEEIKRNNGAGRKKEDNPFAAPVAQAREDGKVKSLTVPAEAEGKVTGFLRRAASDNDHGLSLQVKNNENGTVTILYKAKDKNKRSDKPCVVQGKAECPACHEQVTVT